MIQIRMESRGGQGGKTAGQILAEAAMVEGKYIQAFSEYGPERTGAPVKTYVRISDKPIRTYAPVVNPNLVIVIDPTLFSPKVLEGLGPKGKLIINSKETKEALKKKVKCPCQLFVVDATKIALSNMGKNIPNLAMLGAFAKVTGAVKMKSIFTKTEEHFLRKLGKEKTKANTIAIGEAYSHVK